MVMRVAALASIAALALGCDGGSSQPANNPQGMPGNGTGPLANLESSQFMNEVWLTPEGQQIGVLYYPRENVRVNATCRSPSGAFMCDAMRYMRNGMPVEIPRRTLDGRTSAGVKVCMRMNQPIISVRNSVGAEDSYCRFPDGSMISLGALEQYQMRVIQ